MENRDSDIRMSDIIAEESAVKEYESTPLKNNVSGFTSGEKG